MSLNESDRELSDSELSDSELSGSELSGSELSGSELSGSELSGSESSDVYTQTLLLVGPLPPPIHGQALAFARVVKRLMDDTASEITASEITASEITASEITASEITASEVTQLKTKRDSTTRPHRATVDIIDTSASGPSVTRRVFKLIHTLMQIVKHTLTRRYHTVYFTCSRSVFGALRDIALIHLSAWRGARIVNHLHGSDLYEFLHSAPRGYRWLLHSAYRRVDITIVLLESMRDQLRDFEQMRVEVVPNFYDDEFEVTLDSKSSSQVRLVYLSNIIKSKGVFELIEAFQMLVAHHPQLTLEIAGGFIGDEHMSAAEVRDAFERALTSHAHITYLGSVSGDEKVKLLQRSDIFVLPSYFRSEALPISIIEAMRSGNAIVTTRYKYLPELVTETRGVIVEPRSARALAAGIETLLDRDQLTVIQENNRREASAHYTLKRYLERVSALLYES